MVHPTDGSPPSLADAPSLERFVDVAIDLARGAGRAAMSELPLGLWRGDGVEHKSQRELVSRVDRAAEAHIVAGLREAFPDHAIEGEEGGVAPGSATDAPWRWLVDPIDGTTNFLHGHPFFCVSIALEHRPGGRRGAEGPEIVAAVVFLPYFDEVFFAQRGCGAFLNTRSIPLRVSPTTELADALVATGFPYDRVRFPNFENFNRIASRSLGVRRCGSAAIDLAFVAAGRYDAFWELGLQPHDVAAGALLVAEAGGRVTDLGGAAGWLDGRNLLASNGPLHEVVRELLDPFPQP